MSDKEKAYKKGYEEGYIAGSMNAIGEILAKGLELAEKIEDKSKKNDNGKINS